MEISPALRPILKQSRVIAWTWRTLLALIIIAWTIIWISWTSGDAPGVQTAPPQSQLGKVNPTDPGGAFQCPDFFEHNVFFPNQDQTKLIPHSSYYQAWIGPNQILYCKWHRGENIFNIILIISQTTPKGYLVNRSATSIHKLSTMDHRVLVNYFPVWEIDHFGIKRTFDLPLRSRSANRNTRILA